MLIKIDEIEVVFPYDHVYPEQLDYMVELKRVLMKGHCEFEMPTGTGKTVTLLALILAVQSQNPAVGKLVYCTRTVQEMDKVVEELKRVIEYRTEYYKSRAPVASAHAGRLPSEKRGILGVCLSSRRNMCIHPQVSEIDDKATVDGRCRSLTASFVREKAAAGEAVALCPYFEGLQTALQDEGGITLSGVYSLADMKALGRRQQWYASA